MSSNLIWGLGGHAHGAPSNTLAAYWGGLGAGADGLAVSVSLTSDGVLVCSPKAFIDSDGNEHRSSEMTAAMLQKIDVGAVYRSSQLDEDNRHADVGDDAPWTGRGGHQGFEHHPTLERVLLLFSRRTRLLLMLESDDAELASETEAILQRFGVLDRVEIAGSQAALSSIENSPKVVLVHDAEKPISESIERAAQVNASKMIAGVESLPEKPVSELTLIVVPMPTYSAVNPEQFSKLSQRGDIEGWLVTGVDRMRRLIQPRGLVLEETFSGPCLDESLWAVGYSRDINDTTLKVDEGIQIEMDGNNYSGAAAYSKFTIHGDFDARISFEVSNPALGTTFELAALQIDPGYHCPNLTFDVHGAPPYASSERDEADGFRIGWNNGSALTRWSKDEPRSSNLYNNYSRDVGYGGVDSQAGELRLTRCGELFNAYYRDAANRGWVLSGTALVPALPQSIFIRLAAKHWRKDGNPPPTNKVRMWDLKLFQW